MRARQRKKTALILARLFPTLLSTARSRRVYLAHPWARTASIPGGVSFSRGEKGPKA